MLSALTLILTGDCNFRCRYCYQARDRRSLKRADVRRALEAFFPRFDRGCVIMLYGGEPLLEKGLIREAVETVRSLDRKRRKKIGWSISTNGSLLDDEILDLFETERFTVLLSYDGLAHDKGREKGSSAVVSAALDRLLERPGIELMTNSVFTPDTVADLSASVRGIVERGVPDVQISFSNHRRWSERAFELLAEELAELRRFLVRFGRRTGAVPVANFRSDPRPGIFGCLAGRERMALSPDGRLWGCHLFYDLHRAKGDSTTARYSLGTLEAFMARGAKPDPRVLERYDDLRMDFFHTPEEFCGQCPDVGDCVVCPVDAAFASGVIGRIESDDCRIRRMVRVERQRLAKELDGAVGTRHAAARPRSSRLRARS